MPGLGNRAAVVLLLLENPSNLVAGRLGEPLGELLGMVLGFCTTTKSASLAPFRSMKPLFSAARISFTFYEISFQVFTNLPCTPDPIIIVIARPSLSRLRRIQ